MDPAHLSRSLKSKATHRFVRTLAKSLGLDAGRLRISGPDGKELNLVEFSVPESGEQTTEIRREGLFVLRHEAVGTVPPARLGALAVALARAVRDRETIDGLSRYSLEKQRELTLLYRFGETLNNIRDRKQLLEVSAALLDPRVHSDYVLAAYIDPCDGQWHCVASGSIRPVLIENLRLNALRDLVRKPTSLIFDAHNVPPPFWEDAHDWGSSVAVVPLHQNDEALGAMLFGRDGDGAVYSAEELHLLTTLGFIFSGKLADINSLERLLEEQERAYLEAMQSLAEALEAKDAYTARHSRRVSEFSALLARRVGLPDGELRVLRQAALLHDLGKIGVPDAILNKPGRLTDQEFEIMRGHAAQTAAIMRPLQRFPAFGEIAAWHHERWDGHGYPDGLRGTEIPLAARIVAIADSWDAMTDDRVYRKGMPIDKALGVMERERDSGQWDPVLLDSFIEMIREMQAARHEVLTDMFPPVGEFSGRLS